MSGSSDTTTSPAPAATPTAENTWNVTFYKPDGTEDDIRETTIDSVHIQSLRAAFHNKYEMDPMSVHLKYRKHDGTKITMNSDDDLAKALTNVTDRQLNVFVVPKAPPPGLQLDPSSVPQILPSTPGRSQGIVQGWQRNLLQECVEPNPGPVTLNDVFVALNTRLGEEAEDYETQVRALRNKIKLQSGATAGATEILAYINNPGILAIFPNQRDADFISGLLKEEIEKLVGKAPPPGLQLGPSSVYSIILEKLSVFPPSQTLPPQPPLLIERTEQINQVSSIVKANLKEASKDHQAPMAKTDYNIPVFAGGAGIGKTSLGYAAAQAVIKHWNNIATPTYESATPLYLMIDFSNGCGLSAEDKALSLSVIFGLRLAYAHFGRGIPYGTFCSRFAELESRFTVAAVLEAIREDVAASGLYIIVHIDEVQKIFEKEPLFAHITSTKGFFKDLISLLGGFFASSVYTLQLFISGTAYEQVLQAKEPTMYSFKFISVPLLSLGGVLGLVRYYAQKFGVEHIPWWSHLPFLQLLADLGGLPRPLIYCFDKCFGPAPGFTSGKSFFENLHQIQMFPIFAYVADAVRTKYGIDGFISKNRAAAAQVLRHSICAIAVRRDHMLGGVAVRDMEFDGHVFLEQTREGLILFRMPVLFIHIYNQSLSILPQELAKPFSQDNVTYWQDWEKFNAFFEAFTTNCLVGVGLNCIMLGDLFWRAYGTEKTLNTLVDIKNIQVAQLLHQFPVSLDAVTNTGSVNWKNGEFLLVNAKNAPFGDTVSFYQRHGSEGLIIIAGQEKWGYNGKIFNATSALKEHTTALNTAVARHLAGTIVSVCFTSQPLDDRNGLPDNILVVARQNFKDHYGPFADRASFALAASINPNFSDVQHLSQIPGVGEMTALDIIKCRSEGPFTTAEELVRRVQRVDIEEARKLSYFPFE